MNLRPGDATAPAMTRDDDDATDVVAPLWLGHSPGNRLIFRRPHARGLLSASWMPGVPRARGGWAPAASTVKESAKTCKIYIFKVPKQVHPGVSIDSKIMSTMDSFINDSFEKLAGSVPAVLRVCPGERAARLPGTVDPGDDMSPGDARFQPGKEASPPGLCPRLLSLADQRLSRGRRRGAATFGGKHAVTRHRARRLHGQMVR